MADEYAQRPRYAAPPRAGSYASWGARAAAYLIDYVGPCVALGIGNALWRDRAVRPPLLALALYAAATVFLIWNIVFRQGRTGQTIGKQQLKIRLVRDSDRQPIGSLRAFLRQLAHFFDGLCYIGYLWPLWDPKRQTFADKIMRTVVINHSGDIR